ncbi:MAG TPA: penicillin acylase family protein [Beutenbergiaceae bacterium]|nr:penicillin acylase family protein [Beutenbergiaceae bacterium]
MRRVSLWIAAALVVLLVVSTVTVFTALRRPLPSHAGDIHLAGLGSSVEVIRDEHGVPHLYGDDATDLFYAQGYVHAQDRFFEMDYRRHLTAGRLAELVGENDTAISADQVIRTMGWRRVAEQEWSLLEQESREFLQAYADGVNAYISKLAPGKIALEYTVLGLQVELDEIEPWDPIDSLAWLKAMAWDLLSNFDQELARASIYGHLNSAYGAEEALEMVEEIFPHYPTARNLPILTTPALQEDHAEFRAAEEEAAREQAEREEQEQAQGQLQPGQAQQGQSQQGQSQQGENSSQDDPFSPQMWAAVADAFNAVPNALGEGDGLGSNSWVISGEHTESGMPLLANDPHLGISQPGIWYQMSLNCREDSPECPYEVSGFTFAGLPGVVIGRNAELSWGFTNLAPDVTDLFVEKVFPDSTYLHDGERLELEEREETIRVNGGEDITITVRETHHGPLLSDAMAGANSAIFSPIETAPEPSGSLAVSLAWTALTPGQTGDALFAIGKAKNAEDIAHAAELFEVPSQNIVWATTDGDIGYQAPGKVPLRNKVSGEVPSDGRWPRPGWDSEFDWQGYVPPEEMPAVVNPEEGFIVTANQPVHAPGDTPFLSRDHDYGYRSQAIRDAIEDQIASGEKFTLADMNDLHLIDINPYAEMLLPALQEIEVDDPFVAEAMELFDDWDMRADADSAAAAYFSAVWTNLLRLTFWDQLPESQRPTGGSQWLEAIRHLLEDETNLWWDDRATINVVESRDEILHTALTDARTQLTVLIGKDPKKWSWGELHDAAPTHAVLGGEDIPGVVRSLVNPTPIGVSGGSSIVNANGWDASSWPDERFPSFTVTAVPSMRMAVDMSGLDEATWVNLTGNSGHPMSKNYSDQFSAWAAGETFPWNFSRDAVAAAAKDTQMLLPPGE